MGRDSASIFLNASPSHFSRFGRSEGFLAQPRPPRLHPRRRADEEGGPSSRHRGAVVVYRWKAYLVTMMPSTRRPRLRPLLLVSVLLLLLGVAVTRLSLALRPTLLGVPLDPGIPNEQALIARGLSGVPGPGQPASPIAVDRVVTDGAATYIQFHSTTSPGRFPDFFPQLSDGAGVPVNYGGGASTSDGTPAWARLLLPWFPWRPPTGLLRGVITLGPLPLTARAVVLRFTTGETVRVPLNLAPLRRLPASHSPLLRRAGLQLQAVAARDTGLVLDLSPFGAAHGETLVDGHARLVPFRVVASGCSATGFADGPLACREVWTYSPQPHGARLTLTIRSFTADISAAVMNAVGAGPWRLSVVVP